MKRVLRTAWAGILCAAVAACGGGGGGSDGQAPATNYVNGLSIHINQPASVSLSAYEGQYLPNISINGTLAGDASLLNGKTLALIVVMPDGLYQPNPSLLLNTVAKSASLTMIGKAAPDGAKTYSGNITLKACLDSACQQEIRVDNPTIPYTITVKAGLTVSQPKVTFVTDFGAAVAPVNVPVTLPTNVASWAVTPALGSTGAFSVEKASDGSPNIVVAPKGLMPSNTTYQANFNVTATAADGQKLFKGLDVSVATHPSSAPYALSKPSAHFVVKQGTPNLSELELNSVYFPGTTSDKMSFVDMSLSAPAGADTSMYPSANLWLFFYSTNEAGSPKRATTSDTWETQVQACYGGRCLTTGTYTAQVHFRYAPVGGPVYEIYYPVVMDVVP